MYRYRVYFSTDEDHQQRKGLNGRTRAVKHESIPGQSRQSRDQGTRLISVRSHMTLYTRGNTWNLSIMRYNPSESKCSGEESNVDAIAITHDNPISECFGISSDNMSRLIQKVAQGISSFNGVVVVSHIKQSIIVHCNRQMIDSVECQLIGLLSRPVCRI